jgi:hypothetical protein
MALEDIEAALRDCYSRCATEEEIEEKWGEKFKQVRDIPIIMTVSESIRHSCTVSFWFAGEDGIIKFAFSCVKHPQSMHSYRFRNSKGDMNIVLDHELESYLFLVVDHSIKIIVTDFTGGERSIERAGENDWNEWKWACPV